MRAPKSPLNRSKKKAKLVMQLAKRKAVKSRESKRLRMMPTR